MSVLYSSHKIVTVWWLVFDYIGMKMIAITLSIFHLFFLIFCDFFTLISMVASVNIFNILFPVYPNSCQTHLKLNLFIASLQTKFFWRNGFISSAAILLILQSVCTWRRQPVSLQSCFRFIFDLKIKLCKYFLCEVRRSSSIVCCMEKKHLSKKARECWTQIFCSYTFSNMFQYVYSSLRLVEFLFKFFTLSLFGNQIFNENFNYI